MKLRPEGQDTRGCVPAHDTVACHHATVSGDAAKAASTTAAPPPPAQVDPPVLTEANIVEAVDAAMTLGMLNQVDFASLTELKKKHLPQSRLRSDWNKIPPAALFEWAKDRAPVYSAWTESQRKVG